MKIESSSISFLSQHAMLEVNQKQENLQFWVGDNPNEGMKGPPGVTIDISEIGREMQKSLCSSETQSVEDDMEDMLSEKDKLKLQLIEAMMEYFLGREVKLKLPKKIRTSEEVQPNLVIESPKAGWGLIYDSHKSHYESEKMSFRSTGIIKTADGKEIKVDLQLNMSREFYTSQSIHIRAGDAIRKDPLVINFDSPTAKLSDSKFSFDIDCDGYSDQISQLSTGSGFLSLDLNGDGKINDGSELFGPKSGDGFSDLSLYDGDKNGWIDENDAVFDKLRIWTKDEHGNGTLFALGQKGIGAICLGSAATPFSLKGAENTENGVIQKTGIFLRENGLAGTIQHVDLAV
ncbi:MAG TPA: hypothetical protein VEB00_15830 [Clostridia bacterium]|nr:hypothetical protein [Clostridia bacterium]